MNIGVNLIPLRPGENGGIEVYTRNLLEHILKTDLENKYFLFTAEWNNSTINFHAGNYKKIVIGSTTINVGDKWWRKIKIIKKFSVKSNSLQSHIRKNNIDLLFAPLMGFGVDYLKMPGIVTIPDIQHEFYPFFFSSEELRNRELYWKRSCFMATKIFAISEFTKKTLHDKYGIDENKIQTIYGSIGDEFIAFKGCPSFSEVKDKYSLPNDYCFYPANTWRHKNHEILIMAFHILRRRYSNNIKLILSGFNPDGTDRVRNLIEHYGLTQDVIMLGYVGRYEIPRLYQGASFLVFPSLFEGFGIPPLEAMAVGCPVLASNTTSIPEIVGDAALLFDPRKPDEIAEAMHRILIDRGLREKLIEKGRQRAIVFSWEKAAKETIQLFQDTYRQPSRRWNA